MFLNGRLNFDLPYLLIETSVMFIHLYIVYSFIYDNRIKVHNNVEMDLF